MKILAIDTSAAPVSAAVVQDGFLLGEFFLNVKTTHSQTLMPMIETILSMTASTLSEIDLLAVNAGPGSFTGIRIGVASVKGLSLPQDKRIFTAKQYRKSDYFTAGHGNQQKSAEIM